MGCGASAAGKGDGEGAAGAGKAVKSVSSGDIDKAIATGRSGLVKNQRKAVSLLLGMVVINTVIRERIASEVLFPRRRTRCFPRSRCCRAAYTPSSPC